MDLMSVAVDFQPLEELLQSVRMQGTSEDPLFHLNDVAKHLDESHPERITKDFGDDLKRKLSYKDGNKTRHANFLTEDGLYEFIFLCKKTKGLEFKRMVRNVLKQIRIHVFARMQDKLTSARECIPAIPLPYDDDDEVEYHVKAWLQANTLDQSTLPFNYRDVGQYTLLCVKECVKFGLHDEINILMKQAYDAHINSMVTQHIHFNTILSKTKRKACLPERLERSVKWTPDIRPEFTED